MQIKLATDIGFCFGVKLALDIAHNARTEAGEPIYTYGNIIHNKQVVSSLETEEICSCDSIGRLSNGDTLVIRSHGVPPEVYSQCENAGINLIDATCPFVKRIHNLVKKHYEDGCSIIIAGKHDHPEVTGTNGWCGYTAAIVESAEDIISLNKDIFCKKVCIVAQTTFSKAKYDEICAELLKIEPEALIFDSICSTTLARQQEASILSSVCTKMLIIGDKTSSNTQKLYDICTKNCSNSVIIEDVTELFLENMYQNDIIGIVAGASTPDFTIREVIKRMEELIKTMEATSEVEAEKGAAEASPNVELPENNPSAETETEAVTQEAQPESPEITKEASSNDAAEETEAAPAAEEKPKAEKKPKKAAEKVPEADDTSDGGEPDFEKAFEKTLVRIKNGQIITGTVIQIVDGEVSVNIGYKSDGYIPRSEFSADGDANPQEVFKIGDPIEVEVIKVNDGEGNVLLSRKSIESKKIWDTLVSDEENIEKIFDAVGKEVVKGGLIALIDGIRAFVPASQLSNKFVEDITEFVGKPLRLKVIEVDKQRKRIVASHKAVLVEEANKLKKEKWDKLQVGSTVKGIVRRLTDFGAFVDIGGLDGLVHVTDVAWGRVKHASDVLTAGQEIDVLILNADPVKERISLGYKQLQPKPWTSAAERYPVDSVVEGKVVRIVPFGAFVSLEPTIDGLIHISQVAVKRIVKVEDEINVGDTVRCKVLEVSPEAKRISLSRKAVILDEHPEIEEELAAERAEKKRQALERSEQRSQMEQQKQQERTRDTQEKPDRQDERRHRKEENDYKLPPVEKSTTSLADLLSGINTSYPDDKTEE